MKYAVVFLFPSIALLFVGWTPENGPVPKGSRIPYHHVSFSPDGKWLVAGGGLVVRAKGEGIIKIWDTATWKQQISCTEGFTDPVEGTYFLSNDEVVVASDKIIRQPGNPYHGTLLRFWNIPQKKELSSLNPKGIMGRGARNLGIDGPHKFIAFSRNGINAIYDIPALGKKTPLDDREAMRFRFSPDGKKLLGDVREDAPHLRLFDVSNGKRIATLALDSKNDVLNPTYVRCLDFSSDGKMIAVGEESYSRVYVVAADLSKRIFTIDSDNFPDCVKFSADCKMVAVADGVGGVQLVSIDTKKPVTTIGGNPEGARGWGFSSDGAWIAIASGGRRHDGAMFPGRVRVFEVKTGKLVVELD